MEWTRKKKLVIRWLVVSACLIALVLVPCLLFALGTGLGAGLAGAGLGAAMDFALVTFKDIGLTILLFAGPVVGLVVAIVVVVGHLGLKPK